MDINVNGEALVVQRGDVLVIAFNRKMSQYEFDETEKALKEHLKGVRIALVTEVAALAVIKDVPDNRPDSLVDN